MNGRTACWALLSGLTLPAVQARALATPRPIGRTAQDAELAAEVESELADREPDAAGITVLADDGVVTLSGFVSSRAARRRAEATAWHMGGVKRVDDQLAIRPERPLPIPRATR